MRTSQRNKRPVWYCLYLGETEQTDSDNNYTGEMATNYATPVKLNCNVSPATGQSDTEMFGNLTDYDRVIVTEWVDCPIDENSVLFVDKTPTDVPVPGSDPPATVKSTDGYNYIVRRVAKSINSVSIAIKKVEVTPPPAPDPTPTPTPDPDDDDDTEPDGNG